MTKGTLRADSKASLAVAHLKTLPAGTELSAGEIAMAMSCETHSVGALLKPALTMGVLKSRPIEGRGRALAYRLGTDSLAKRVASVFDLGGAPPQAQPTSAGGFKRWLEKKGEPSAEGRPKRRNAAAVVVVPAAPSATPAIGADPSLMCALFNNGALLIEAPGQPSLRLSRDQARDLVVYLQRISLTQELVA